MGYYTQFKLRSFSDKGQFEECSRFILNALDEASRVNAEVEAGWGKKYRQEYIDDCKALTTRCEELLDSDVIETLEYLDTNGSDMKWYEHEEHMAAISAVFPKMAFVLEGTGEEHGDIWVKVFEGGSMTQSEKAVLTVPEFDPVKMNIRMVGRP